MLKHYVKRQLSLRQETIRILSSKDIQRVVGGTAGGSDPSNTVSGDDCSGGQGHTFQDTCIKPP